jgi:hypothetical protein
MPAVRTLECDLKTEVDFVPLKTEVDFRMPRGADFELRLRKSTLDCHVKRTLDATAVVDFVPCGVDLRCKKWKALSGKQKQKKSEKTSIFAVRAGLRLRPKSTCATGVGLGATVSVDLCHRSGLGCDR